MLSNTEAHWIGEWQDRSIPLPDGREFRPTLADLTAILVLSRLDGRRDIEDVARIYGAAHEDMVVTNWDWPVSPV